MSKRYTSRKRTARTVLDAYDEAIREYNSYIQRDRFEAVKAGATSIPEKGFTNKENERAAAMVINGLKYKALGTIAEQKEAVKDKLTEAPSYEAAAYAVAIAGRDDMTKEEINAGLERFSDHNTQRTILAAAKRSGHKDYYDKTDVEVYSEDLDYLASSIERFFSPANIAESSTSEGRQLVERGIIESISKPHRDGIQLFENILSGESQE